MEKINIDVDVIIGDKFTNDLMHGADMFETFKQLGEHHTLTINGTPKKELVGEDLDNALSGILNNFKTSLESEYNLVFIAVRSVDDKRVKNPPVFIKPNVSLLSNGTKFGLLKDVLEFIGYTATTDENMRVLTATY